MSGRANVERPPRAQAISSLLRGAGFSRSLEQKSSIRGLREHSEGYRVTQVDAATVLVEHLPSSLRARQLDPKRMQQMLNRYGSVILAEGWCVLMDYASPNGALTVTTTACDARQEGAS